MSFGKVLEAASLKVYVNGDFLGWTNGISHRASLPVRELYQVDSSIPAELVPTVLNLTCTLQVYRGRGQGGAEGMGVVPFGEEIVKQKYNVIEVLDRSTDVVVDRYIDCLVLEQQWNLMPKSIWQGTITFRARVSSNESDV
jgi:hypothetical protein